MDSKICRACLDRTATISLFDKLDDIQYREKIRKCVGVTVEEGDGLPDAICSSCAAELAVSWEFAQKCEASDRALRCLGLLQTPSLKEEPKAEVKQESTIERTQELTYELLNYSDYDNLELSDCKDDLDVDLIYSDSKDDKPKAPKDDPPKKKKSKLQEKYMKPLPNHLRKIKHRVFSGPIQCMACGRVLKCHSAYEQHMLTHTKEKPFSCDLCKKCFRGKSSMKRHIYKHYGVDEAELRKPLPDWDGRRRENKSQSSPILCIVCGLRVSCRSALVNHMRKHTGDKPYSCNKCKKSYALKGSLMRHIDRYHSKLRPLKFVCEHCGKNFYTKSTIIIHLRIHTGEKPYTCPYCGERFAQLSSLIRHKRTHTGEKPFACETCGKSFRDRSLVSKHQAVHSEARNFICHICSKALKTRQALRTHMELHNNPGKFICNYCGAAFTMKGNLNLHVVRIHSEKSGICSVCEKTFPNLQVHMRVHNGEKPYVCKLCSQGFMTQRGLSHHIGFKHRDSEKFKCTTGQCDKAFPTISMLEFHVLKAHLADTPYVCPHCARGFLRPCDLSRHLKVNHMDNTSVKSQFIKTVHISDPYIKSS